MQTFDQSILKLFHESVVAEDTALAYASRKSVARRGIDDLKKQRGIMTSDIEELALDREYGVTLTGNFVGGEDMEIRCEECHAVIQVPMSECHRTARFVSTVLV
jgi:hypothetical protein